MTATLWEVSKFCRKPLQHSVRVGVVDASQEDDPPGVAVNHSLLEAIDQLAGVVTDHPGVNPGRMVREGSPRPRLVLVGGGRRAHEDDRGPEVVRRAASR